MPTSTILIVDDQPTNLRILSNALEKADYTVRAVNTGEAAITSAQHAVPDLILLDVMMPGLDGFETCRRLKAHELTREIPIIFVTALAETFDEVQGFTSGAVDYITKPIHVETMLARIRTHLSIKDMQHQLQQQNAELNAYAHMVAHDLKNPLSAILGGTQYVLSSSRIAEHADLKAYLEIIYTAGTRAVTTIDELLALARIRNTPANIEPLDMQIIVDQALLQIDLIRRQEHGSIILPESWPVAEGHAPWIVQVWINYLSNGLKYGGQPPHLVLGADEQDNMVRFWIKDNGRGLDAQDSKKLFREGVRLHSERADSHGLGLAIVRTIIEKLGGTVGVESSVGNGSCFYFTLPAMTPSMEQREYTQKTLLTLL